MKPLFPIVLLVLAANAQAQDALRGKRLYLDADRLVGSGVSCVDCHGGLPGGAFGIGRAANTPEIIERAVASIAPMAPFRTRLNAQDFADLAAYIGDPNIPSPDLRVTTTAPAGGAAAGDRIDFGSVISGTRSPTGSMQLVNVGQVSLQLNAAPRIVGASAADFGVIGTDCLASMTLQPQQSCRIDLAFQPLSGSGARSAAVQVDHDWVEGVAALALLGNATVVSVTPPPQASGASAGGGGGLAFPFALALVLAQWARRVASSGSRRQG